MDKITYKSIKKMPEVNAYIEQGNRVLGILGYTEHSRGHAGCRDSRRYFGKIRI